MENSGWPASLIGCVIVLTFGAYFILKMLIEAGVI